MAAMRKRMKPARGWALVTKGGRFVTLHTTNIKGGEPFPTHGRYDWRQVEIRELPAPKRGAKRGRKS
jgi:hypothetical protein